MSLVDSICVALGFHRGLAVASSAMLEFWYNYVCIKQTIPKHG